MRQPEKIMARLNARNRPSKLKLGKWVKSLFRVALHAFAIIYTFLAKPQRPTSSRWVKAMVWSFILFVATTYTVLTTSGITYNSFNVLRWVIREDSEANSLTEEDSSVYTGNLTWQQMQETRVQHVSQVCSALNLTQALDHSVLKHILVDTKHKALMCFVPKVACTSWKRMWFWLSGLVEEDEDVMALTRPQVHGPFLSTLASFKFSDERKQEMLRTYKKFIFTRHPLDRLISAYKDKLENVDEESNFDFHKHVGQEVERMVRGRVTGQGHNVTFSEFITWVTPPNGTWTFAQKNEHWLPMTELCAPCAVQYDVIGRYEHLQKDVNQTLHWLGAGQFAERFPQADRPYHATSLHKEYLQRLSMPEKLRFLRTYLLDFLLFGYEMT
ncbi:carbohydrate sulfotransferase 11-like isoform X1 [Penaeus monodon]|uniref:carbohydrate sulfotransferase 11-like isoform X1 n=1 Tax=Penaeus monodon TaxID=6687 RepID=UPI0018A6DDE7|nr:carbohydrate sulfotransferase 11-like isoform X1 [Penaeus monodon]